MLKFFHVILHQIVSARVRQQFSQWSDVGRRKLCVFFQVVQYVQHRRLLQAFRQAAVKDDQLNVLFSQVLSEICNQLLVSRVAIFAVPFAQETGAFFEGMTCHVQCVETAVC